MTLDNFNFTDAEFLKVINSLCRIDLEADEYTPLTSINDKLNVDEDDFEINEQEVDWMKFNDIIGHYSCLV